MTMRRLGVALITVFFLSVSSNLIACSIVYFIDEVSYWYETKDYIQINPAKKGEYARLWYGWKDFAQGGVNAAGLFFDAAVTPKQPMPEGFKSPNGRNIGDEILAKCKNVAEAILLITEEKIAVDAGHMMFGDARGNAVVLEWIDGEQHLTQIEGNSLIATNFLLADTSAGNFPCYRYASIETRIKQLNEKKEAVDLNEFGNVIAGAVQMPREDENGKVGGTLYSSFIDLTDMKLVVVPKLNNENAVVLDLKEEFARGKKKKIKLKG